MNLLLKSGREEFNLIAKSWYDRLFMFNQFKNVHSFILFLGHPRSGHSLIGSLLNQHSDVLISHELDFFYYLQKYNFSREMMFRLIYNRDRWFRINKKGQWTGYDYNFGNRFRDKDCSAIKVIGDKKGGISSKRLVENIELLKKGEEVIKLPIKFIFISRNPFDNIATRMMRESKVSDGGGVDKSHLKCFIESYFQACNLAQDLSRNKGYDVYIAGIEDFINDAYYELEKLFKWIGVSCTSKLLESLALKINKEESKTRFQIEWESDIKREIEFKVSGYSFLKKYTFD